jgi:acetyl-CoA acyltransferase
MRPSRAKPKSHDTTIGWRFVNPLLKSQYGIDSMPETGENVAEDFGISREDQDAFALRSQTRAGTRASSPAVSPSEIVAVEIPRRKGDPVVVETPTSIHAAGHDSSSSWPSSRRPFRAGGSRDGGQCVRRQ